MTADMLLSYYGDDFTGSTDVMEALATGGVETVLFTCVPNDDQRRQFRQCRAIGLAGTSRSQSPEWMSDHLPEIFAWLRALDARFCHYKVCSTFDSAPHKGSIGRALEIGLATFNQRHGTIVVGAPQLRRYTYFGTLFAAYQDRVYRIDKHPVMSRHPATPMDEADLVSHLGRQTRLPVTCLTPEDMADHLAGEPCLKFADPQASVLIDVFDTGSQQAAGDMLDEKREILGPFVAGSSGVEYALLSAWRKQGLVSSKVQPAAPLGSQPRIAVVSGSCSPTTGRQIEHAMNNGFCGIKVDFAALAGGIGLDEECQSVLERASAALKTGQSPILYTAKGAADSSQASGSLSTDRVGKTLGRLLARLTLEHDLERVAVAGGDTSSHALEELDIFALTLRHAIPETPGSPVCTAHRSGGHPLEIALKGGQIGNDSYLVSLRDGAFGH
ncbi:four-carbon acid sugar kinase family protein [Roseibium salinum]|uniref:Four-carbon acid sugar kinase family protein n=1 Tax=Roseibium salinum TaxID=1604349 RepID=A0ABT3QXF0_9HYPH|nr:four-carbon acid sugar kinase family protein [Roseibium sp. DSM 29163]MCX2721585.1 four-carbon acid sugar kinase family protein [Roseibium sp. DSM 29163]MDN3722048.1 four-carbon acid sugar kinase family protein [Roseibium salinum]